MFENGFPVESPQLVVPWRISEVELVALFEPGTLRHVTHGYYTTSCIALAGLSIELGFHFEPRRHGKLREFEVFRGAAMDLRASFDEFQSHLTGILGQSTNRELDAESGFVRHVWRHATFHVVHFVQERFGPEEHVRVRSDATG